MVLKGVIEMKIVLYYIIAVVLLLPISLNAANEKAISRYPFDNRFSINTTKSVEKVKQQFESVSDSEVIDIISDISFAPGCSKDAPNLQLITRFRQLGFGSISALEHAACNADADIRRKAIWMACYLVYYWEDRKSGYAVVEESLSWLFCRSMLDIDKNVRNEARIGLTRITGFRVPDSPIPQGAIEGLWLYEMNTPDTVDYRKVMNGLKRFKIPKPEAWFIELANEYETKKAELDASVKNQDDTKNPETSKSKQ